VELSIRFSNDSGVGISMFNSVAEVHNHAPELSQKPEDLPVHVIDDQVFAGSLCGLQLQTELFLHCRERRCAAGGVGRSDLGREEKPRRSRPLFGAERSL
jgi:hypothetical protein